MAGPAPAGESSGSQESSTCPRGQVEPFAALAAVLAVGLAVSLYATALSDADLGASTDRSVEHTLSVVHRNVSEGGVVRPGRIRQAPDATPPGYHASVTLTVAGERWRAGPTPPESAPEASRRVSVRLGPGNVRPGRLTVVIWS